MTSKAYKGSRKLKADVLARLRAHRKADRILQGAIGHYSYETKKNGEPRESTWRGCSVACLGRSLYEATDLWDSSIPHTYDHGHVAVEMGISVDLVRLNEFIFENLPFAASKAWPLKFADAIPVGADTDAVVSAMLDWAKMCGIGLPWECTAENAVEVGDKLLAILKACKRAKRENPANEAHA